MAATFPPFQRLPEQVRRDIFRLAASNPRLAAQDPTVPIPITRGNLTLFRNQDIVGDRTANNTATQSTLTIDRTRVQRNAYQPLLSLCSVARAETAGTEVFQLSLGTYDLPSKLCNHLLRTRLPGTSSPSVPRVPVVDGATRDLILIQPPANTTWYTGEELLSSLSHVFGRNVRRIYLHDEPTKQWYTMIAQQTRWRYLFDRDFGTDGLDRIIEGVFPGLDAALGDGNPRHSRQDILLGRSPLGGGGVAGSTQRAAQSVMIGQLLKTGPGVSALLVERKENCKQDEEILND